ncbi:MAG TPA: NifU family protein [Solirubrobacteraceae bacterium]|jgi:Fe-S cluster biogenesis protein NfuA/nitrite reductase/ring-hydroxylating ferredoxin subunit|nr:NifU family protein [Solirubrobacteraceae bacterium]
MSADVSPAELLEAVEQLSARVDALEDEEARELAQDLVGAVVAMYGDGLRRIMEVISEARGAGDLLDELAQDGAVASLLLIHDLYPVPLEQRVLEALDTVRPYMESHGGNVELLGIEDGVAKLALQGSCDGCAASRSTLELAIKQALDEHAPDLLDLDVEGVTPPVPIAGNGTGGLELPMVHSGEAELPMADAAPASWIPLEQATDLHPGQLRAVQVDAVELLVVNVEGSLVAYRDACAACGEPLRGGDLAGRMLRCASCGADFDLRRAGRAAGDEPLQLTPIPLLEAGGVRVAV